MREESTITKLTRTPFRANLKERSRSADAKIQQRASTSEGCPAASCCQRLLAESSATADLQVPNRKQRRASLSASTGDQKLPRAVRRPHTQLEMPERTHASATPRPADLIGSRRTVPIAPRRRRRSNPLAEAPPSRAQESLFMYYTADTTYQADQDWARVQERLAQYSAEHRVPISTHLEVAGRTTAEPRQALDR